MAAEQVEVAVVQLCAGRLRGSSTNDPDPGCSNSRNLRTHILRLLGPETHTIYGFWAILMPRVLGFCVLVPKRLQILIYTNRPFGCRLFGGLQCWAGFRIRRGGKWIHKRGQTEAP